MFRSRSATVALVALALAGCQRVTGREPALPAELASMAESSAGAEPRWATLEIHGDDGPLRVRIPVLLFVGGAGSPPGEIDTVALAAVERRLLGRIGAVARAEAAALLQRSGIEIASPELLADIAFAPGDTLLDEQGAARVRSLVDRVADAAGIIEVRGYAAGIGAAETAVARARAVWAALVHARSDLAGRAVYLTGAGEPRNGGDGGIDRVEIRSLPYPPP